MARRYSLDALSARGLGPWLTGPTVAVAATGSMIALAAVLAPALARLADGLEGMAEARPDRFAWPVFVLGWSLVAWAARRALRPAHPAA